MLEQAIDGFAKTGRFWIRGALSGDVLRTLAEAGDVGERPGVRFGNSDMFAGLFEKDSVLSRAIQALSLSAAPVRLLAFNKSAQVNWAVPWHQDRVIALAHKVDTAGYGPWVQKEGFWHCEPPSPLLSSMVFARIHIDEANERNGALQLALGSHAYGKVASGDAAKITGTCEIEMCEAQPGDILIASALILHRSSSAKSDAPRRALRVDFAPRDSLPENLTWSTL